jgi:hypothetical protein
MIVLAPLCSSSRKYNTRKVDYSKVCERMSCEQSKVIVYITFMAHRYCWSVGILPKFKDLIVTNWDMSLKTRPVSARDYMVNPILESFL